jgi:colanic acid biosynthesis glycosyl transferase WcaI
MNSLDTLLEAARLLKANKDIGFLLVGAGERKPQYKSFCDEHDLTNVTFVDAKPRREMAVFHAVTDVCVHLTPAGDLWAGMLSNKVFDYLGHGSPLVFAGTGDTAELVRSSNGGVVIEPEEPAAFADAIRELAEDPERVEELGNNAREHMIENYQREDVLETYEQVLISVVGGSEHD